MAYKIAGSNEQQYTWSVTGYSNWVSTILRFTGHDATTPIPVEEVGYGLTNAPIAPSASFSSLESGSLALCVFGANDAETPYTVPGALTTRINATAALCGTAGGEKAVSGTGSTGTATFGMSASTKWVSITAIIEAAASGGVVMPVFYDHYAKLRRG